MIEFLEDLIDADPTAEFPRHQVAEGTVTPRTGDTIADDWFKKVAEGETPDFMAAFDAEDQAKIAALLKPKSKTVEVAEKAAAEMPEDFSDDYTKDFDDATE